MKGIYIKWLDATRSDDEAHISDPPSGIYCHTLGWLVKENGSVIRVALEVSPDEKTVRQYMDIPKPTIVEMRHLRTKFIKK